MTNCVCLEEAIKKGFPAAFGQVFEVAYFKKHHAITPHDAATSFYLKRTEGAASSTEFAG
jgi:hypothetical protein